MNGFVRTARMADAAYAQNITGGFEIAAGYYGGPSAYHVWPVQDWNLFPGHRLPIFVGGLNGTDEGYAAVALLTELGVPPHMNGLGTMTALDMENRHDRTYVNAFQGVMNRAGYLVWDYGSLNSVLRDPEANGFWVADYTSIQEAEMLLAHGGTRAVQYLPNQTPGYDVSLVKQWTLDFMWHG